MTDDPEKPIVALSNRQGLAVNEEELAVLARRTLEAEGAGGVELSLSFVTAEEMAELHQRYLDEPGPTDVLSFPQDGEAPERGPRLLGDVVVCPAVAAERPDPEPEMRLLVVHGVLHLLGYDHDEDEDRRTMWERQERYSGVRA